MVLIDTYKQYKKVSKEIWIFIVLLGVQSLFFFFLNDEIKVLFWWERMSFAKTLWKTKPLKYR